MLLMWPCWFGLAYSGKSFYNLIYLGIIHIVIYYGKIYEKLFQ